MQLKHNVYIQKTNRVFITRVILEKQSITIRNVLFYVDKLLFLYQNVYILCKIKKISKQIDIIILKTYSTSNYRVHTFDNKKSLTILSHPSKSYR